MICFQAVTVVGAKPHTKETDLIHEAPRWYPGLTVLRKKPAGAAAIPGGEPSGPLHMFQYNYLLPPRTIRILLSLLKKSYVPRTP